MFDNTTNAPSSYPTPAVSDQKSAGALTHISSVSKVPTPPIETFFNPSNYVHRSAIDTAYEQKNSNGSRKFGIYPSATKNTFVYEASISSKSDFYDDEDSFFSAPDDASVLARSSLETLQSVWGIGGHGSDSDGSDHSPSRIIPPNLPALIEAQKNYNAGVISVALPEGSVSSDSDTDSTITEGPYNGQDSAPDATSTAMQRYYAMMSSRPPVSEDRRILPPPSQPQNSATALRAPTISQPPGIVGLTRHSAPHQRRQDLQTPLPRDSLVLPPAAPMQRQDSGYAGRIPRRPSLEREQRTILPPGLSTSPGAHSTIAGQPSAPPAYTPGRPRRDSLTPSAPPQQARRDSVSAAPQPPIQPVRRDSISVPQPPQSVHRNSVSAVPQPPLPVRRATDPLPASNPSPPVSARRSSDSAPRGQGLLVSTRVRFNDENLICPSPIPMHERRRGWHNRRGDQLWTNKGDYKPAPPGQGYPPDLASYPDYGEGWMNEEGMRIDMQHRLIPKPPLRSALKRSRQPSNAGANPPPPFLSVRP